METANSLPNAEALYTALKSKLEAALPYDARLVGIHSGGAWLAERLARELPGEHPVGSIDISFYRDDYNRTGLHANVRPSDIPFEVDGAHILLIDDVLFTGRSVRAAMNELFDYGRPAAVELAVLIDRGGRELPIEAGYVGASLMVGADLQLVLERDTDGHFSLSTAPMAPRD